MLMKSKDYHDYVFKDGKFVGDFDGMYQHSADIPWHMDKGVEIIFSRICVTILKKFHEELHFKTICDVGCGLGYMAKKIATALDGVTITGLELSQTAVDKAKKLFPEITFRQYDLLVKNPPPEEPYDLVMAKNFLWYVLENVDLVFENIAGLTKKHFFMTQSFPSAKTFFGQDLFPNANALADFIATKFNIIYKCVELNDAGEECLHVFTEKKA